MSTAEYARTINRTPRTVTNWCNAGLIGKRVGGRWEIEDGTPPPAIVPKRKVNQVPRSKVRRLDNFVRKRD